MKILGRNFVPRKRQVIENMGKVTRLSMGQVPSCRDPKWMMFAASNRPEANWLISWYFQRKMEMTHRPGHPRNRLPETHIPIPSVSTEYHQKEMEIPQTRKEHRKEVTDPITEFPISTCTLPPSPLPTRRARVFAASAAQGSKPPSRAMIGS